MLRFTSSNTSAAKFNSSCFAVLRALAAFFQTNVRLLRGRVSAEYTLPMFTHRSHASGRSKGLPTNPSQVSPPSRRYLYRSALYSRRTTYTYYQPHTYVLSQVAIVTHLHRRVDKTAATRFLHPSIWMPCSVEISRFVHPGTTLTGSH